MIPAGAVRYYMPLIVLRDPSLEISKVRLKIGIGENEYFKQGIDEELVQKCIQKDLIFQSVFKNIDTGYVYKQVAFVGFDHQKSIPKYINLRGIHNDYKGDSFGSNKAFSFV